MSTISLLLWLSLVIANCLIYILTINTPKVYLFCYIIVLLNFSNSFVNPAVYSLRRPLRILEFRQALGFCITRRRKPDKQRRKEQRGEITGGSPQRRQYDHQNSQMTKIVFKRVLKEKLLSLNCNQLCWSNQATTLCCKKFWHRNLLCSVARHLNKWMHGCMNEGMNTWTDERTAWHAWQWNLQPDWFSLFVLKRRIKKKAVW